MANPEAQQTALLILETEQFEIATAHELRHLLATELTAGVVATIHAIARDQAAAAEDPATKAAYTVVAETIDSHPHALHTHRQAIGRIETSEPVPSLRQLATLSIAA